MNQERDGKWDATNCALLLMDYQDTVLAELPEQDRSAVELNALTLATAATDLDIPIVLGTVGVGLGMNGPTIPLLASALADIEPIDRSRMNAWEHYEFVEAVTATGRSKLVMAGIVTSVCLTYSALSALADGYQVAFIEDAVADITAEFHDFAVGRLANAGAAPSGTIAMISEWFRDWDPLLPDSATRLFMPTRERLAAPGRAHDHHETAGLT
jgi:nicotinamidase-related amidase